MINLEGKLVKNGFDWVQSKNGSGIINSDSYCSSRDIFIARLDKLRIELEKSLSDTDKSSLITAIVGEIGNNSFDHNLGSWRDVAGIYFVYDLDSRMIVLADRGQGVKNTLLKVRPDIKGDLEALKIAFTQTISGRSPEHRGNGLKFVRKVIEENKFELYFQSGKAIARIYSLEYALDFLESKNVINGTISIICYR